MIFADVRAGPAIESRAETLEFASTNHPCECARVNALGSGITGSQKRTTAHEAQHVRASGWSMLRHYGYAGHQLLAFCHTRDAAPAGRPLLIKYPKTGIIAWCVVFRLRARSRCIG